VIAGGTVYNGLAERERPHMTNEEMERAIQFILNQQAQFAAHMQEMKETTGTLLRSHTDLTKALVTVVGLIGDLSEAQKATNARVDQLTGRMDQLTGKVDQLTDTVAELTERLNAFIIVVERYISGNGKPKPPSS
jgi:chromosome segregation ATPase